MKSAIQGHVQTKREKKVKRAYLLAGLAEYGPAKAFDEIAEGRGRVRWCMKV